MDAAFAGFGQYLTGSDGAFRFRTIKAGLYQGRTRHFHWGVTIPGRLVRTTTQTFWNEVATGANDRHLHAATAEGALDLFVEAAALKGFYYVSFRVPGANTGTPGTGGGGPPPP